MLVVTTNDIPGWEIQRVCGEVFGLTVRSRNAFSQFGAGFKSMFGGELQGMTKNLAESRNEAMARLINEARNKGGNAIVAMRFDTTEIGECGPRSALTAPRCRPCRSPTPPATRRPNWVTAVQHSRSRSSGSPTARQGGTTLMVTPNRPGDPSEEPPWSGQPPGYGANPQPQNPPGPAARVPAPAWLPAAVRLPRQSALSVRRLSFAGLRSRPQAPFGRDPATGEPLSDKSAVVAGLLQLFLGGLGIGRFYIGSTSIGAVQLCLGLFGFFFSWIFIGIPVLLGVGIWAFVDAIIMFTGGVKDNYGRKLR